MSQLAVTSTPSHPRPLVFHREPRDRPAEGSHSHWLSGVGLQEGCTRGSETGLGEEVPLSRGNGTFKGPEARGKQHRVRLETGSLGTQSPGRVQRDPPPLGHQQSLVPLGKSDVSWGSLCPVGISGPILSACQMSPASAFRAWGLPWSGALVSRPGSGPGLSGLTRSYLQGGFPGGVRGLVALGHLLPPATEGPGSVGRRAGDLARFLCPSVRGECPECS